MIKFQVGDKVRHIRGKDLAFADMEEGAEVTVTHVGDTAFNYAAPDGKRWSGYFDSFELVPENASDRVLGAIKSRLEDCPSEDDADQWDDGYRTALEAILREVYGLRPESKTVVTFVPTA